MDQRELMTLQHYLKEYGQQAEIFVGQLELLENGRMEALAAIEALEGMLATDDGIVLLQIGGGASVRAKVLEPEKILLSIGAEVVVERSNKDAVEFLKERIMEMEASQKKVAETLDRLRSQMNEINKRLESGYQQSVSSRTGSGLTGLFSHVRGTQREAAGRPGTGWEAVFRELQQPRRLGCTRNRMAEPGTPAVNKKPSLPPAPTLSTRLKY